MKWPVIATLALLTACGESGMPIGERDRLHGFAGYSDDGTAVVYTLPPNRVDDAVICTLGHEVMHLALGEYHR